MAFSISDTSVYCVKNIECQLLSNEVEPMVVGRYYFINSSGFDVQAWFIDN